jgi:large subunit ribosomal protein L10
MRGAGAGYKVAKNRLAQRALKGTKYEGLDKLFKGPTAIAYSKDPVAAAKVAVAYAKSNEKLTIVGGSMGTDVLGPEGITALATLPSLDELRAKLVGMLQTPATRGAARPHDPAGAGRPTGAGLRSLCQEGRDRVTVCSSRFRIEVQATRYEIA